VSKLDIESVDYEEQVVKKMQEGKLKGLSLNYAVGDVTDLKAYQAEEFSYAVDKGTLDAIAVNDKQETLDLCNGYFNEMCRVLKNKNGVFMFVSLLQPHVLKIVIDFFVKENTVNKYQRSSLF
jgi:ubiquinone/menaquinone biosynthesis C-methylase UbiE